MKNDNLTPERRAEIHEMMTHWTYNRNLDELVFSAIYDAPTIRIHRASERSLEEMKWMLPDNYWKALEGAYPLIDRDETIN